jgi:hypothetical protein
VIIGLLLVACHREKDPVVVEVDTGTWEAVTEPAETTPPSPCGSWTGVIEGRTHTYLSEGPGYSSTTVNTIVSVDDAGLVERAYRTEGSGYWIEGVESGACEGGSFYVASRVFTFDDGGGATYTYEPPILQYQGALDLGLAWSQASIVSVDASWSDPYEYEADAALEVAAQETVSVAAGAYATYRVDFSYDGQVLGSEWIADGVGRVLYVGYDGHGRANYSVALVSVTDD